jgi:hypothetical protein
MPPRVADAEQGNTAAAAARRVFDSADLVATISDRIKRPRNRAAFASVSRTARTAIAGGGGVRWCLLQPGGRMRVATHGARKPFDPARAGEMLPLGTNQFIWRIPFDTRRYPSKAALLASLEPTPSFAPPRAFMNTEVRRFHDLLLKNLRRSLNGLIFYCRMPEYSKTVTDLSALYRALSWRLRAGLVMPGAAHWNYVKDWVTIMDYEAACITVYFMQKLAKVRRGPV